MERKSGCCGTENMGTGFCPCTPIGKKAVACLLGGLMFFGISAWLIKKIYHL